VNYISKLFLIVVLSGIAFAIAFYSLMGSFYEGGFIGRFVRGMMHASLWALISGTGVVYLLSVFFRIKSIIKFSAILLLSFGAEFVLNRSVFDAGRIFSAEDISIFFYTFLICIDSLFQFGDKYFASKKTSAPS